MHVSETHVTGGRMSRALSEAIRVWVAGEAGRRVRQTAFEGGTMNDDVHLKGAPRSPKR